MSYSVKGLSRSIVKVIITVGLGLIGLILGPLVISLTGMSELTFEKKPWIASSIIHTAMLVYTLLAALVLSKGRLSIYGFRIPRKIPASKIIGLSFLIGLVGAIIQQFLSSEEPDLLRNFPFIHQVIFIWIYASICEEALTRGLIQSFLRPLKDHRIRLLTTHISLPVIVSALFFSLMHLPAFGKTMNIYALLFFLMYAVILGIIAGYYREKIGSLVPAILVHMVFNISGTLISMFF